MSTWSGWSSSVLVRLGHSLARRHEIGHEDIEPHSRHHNVTLIVDNDNGTATVFVCPTFSCNVLTSLYLFGSEFCVIALFILLITYTATVVLIMIVCYWCCVLPACAGSSREPKACGVPLANKTPEQGTQKRSKVTRQLHHMLFQSRDQERASTRSRPPEELMGEVLIMEPFVKRLPTPVLKLDPTESEPKRIKTPPQEVPNIPLKRITFPERATLREKSKSLSMFQSIRENPSLPVEKSKSLSVFKSIGENPSLPEVKSKSNSNPVREVKSKSSLRIQPEVVKSTKEKLPTIAEGNEGKMEPKSKKNVKSEEPKSKKNVKSEGPKSKKKAKSEEPKPWLWNIFGHVKSDPGNLVMPSASASSSSNNKSQLKH